MLNNDIHNIFEQYVQLFEQQNLGNLIGATSGGQGGNWGGSLPKLISILPMGNWNASSQKRSKTNTASGNVSDHFQGNLISYAADFGLNSTFNSNANAATDFAVKVARKAGRQVDSWDQFKGNHCTINTPDGYRVQIIWQSNVGGNHYDHVHVGVKKTGNASFNPTKQQKETESQDTDNAQTKFGSLMKKAKTQQTTSPTDKDTQQTTPVYDEDPDTNSLWSKISNIYSKGITTDSAKEALKVAAGAGQDIFKKYSKNT
jgi:hypothetical protein